MSRNALRRSFVTLTGRRIASLAISMVLAVSAASAQVPVKGGQKTPSGQTPLTRTPATPSGTATGGSISPLAAAISSPDRATTVVGPAGKIVADRASSSAALAAALVPSARRYVPVTVLNRSGGRVPLLRPTDLAIVEDGVRQRVTSIERWPLWLVVVLDVGRQIGPVKQLAVHRQLVYDVLYGLGEDDHVAIGQYSDGIDVIQPWTQDRTEAEQAVEAKFESGLDGQLWDSIGYSIEKLLDGKLGHKVVVCITDGVDETGHDVAYTRALGLVRDSATTIHIVNLGRYLEEHIRREAYGVNGVLNVIKSPSFIGRRKELRQYGDRLDDAPDRMQTITSESGGLLWVADPDKDPLLLPREVWQQVEGQFMVAYEPERDGAARSPKPDRGFQAFPTRGDIDARVPARLYVPIVPPRSAPVGTELKRSAPRPR
jgi:hypothetical protein